VDNQHL
jgi:hypothetical protein